MEETSWKFYLTASEAWEAMLEDCAKAQVCIDFEQYILSNDEIGKKFFEVFLAKVKAGVKVRLLCDSAGSHGFHNSGSAKALIKAGVMINFFNPISPWRLKNFTSLFFRDHKKILIIDSKIGYTGGVGIEKVMANWRDTHIRIVGPIVHEMQYVFNRMWKIVEYGIFLKFRFPYSFPGAFRFFTVSPHFRQRFFYRRLINKIKSAKNFIYLTTPYFVPNQRFFISLTRAARRGVDIRLIVPKNSDHPFVDAASRSYFGLALKAGIKIYLYKDNVMHAKTAVIDDNWASVGSANLDNMSMLLNYEANLVSEDHKFIGELKDHFINDLMFASELSLEDWQGRSIFQKIYELITWPFHSLL
jgi:cardiolipin synthase